MPERAPLETTNIDRYGDPALPWQRARDVLTSSSGGSDVTWFLGTVRPDGRPHAAGIGALWEGDELYFTTSPDAAKGRHLAANPAATLSARLEGLDLVFEGDAERVTDHPTLSTVAARYRDGGWPAEVDDAAGALTAPYSAPSAGPPPWQVYRLRFHTVFAVATAEPYGATRWRFEG
jgi:hypothetical protein